jgi:hypothetical protein
MMYSGLRLTSLQKKTCYERGERDRLAPRVPLAGRPVASLQPTVQILATNQGLLQPEHSGVPDQCQDYLARMNSKLD